jgi:hypothetical protein
MPTYIVKSDKQFFDRFQELKFKIEELSCIFQNSQTEISYIEKTEWNNIAQKLKQELYDLVYDANKRIKVND